MTNLMMRSLVVLLFAAGSAMAEENVLARAVARCADDIDAYCPHVKPGNGRLMGCLYSNETKISSECGLALNALSLEYESVIAKGADIIDACETEREAFCPTAEWGQGGVVKCLALQSHTVESVSASCRLTLEKHGLI